MTTGTLSDDSPARYLARVYRDGSIEGGGLLIASDLVVSCAHVLFDEAVPSPEVLETMVVTVDIPARDPARRYTGTIVGFAPLVEPAAAPGGMRDLLVIRLDAHVAGFEAAPPILVSAAITGDPFRVIGFPRGSSFDDGVEATGVIGQRAPDGWVQLDDEKVSGYPLTGGFSGAPVWDDRAGAFVGLVAHADVDRGIKSGAMVPIGDFVRHSSDAAAGMLAGLARRWCRWEAERKGELALRHAIPIEGPVSPLNISWLLFNNQRAWHDEVGEQIERVRAAIGGLPEARRELLELAARLGRIDLAATYPAIVRALGEATIERTISGVAAMIREEERSRPSRGTDELDDRPRLRRLRELQSVLAGLARIARQPRFRLCFLTTGTFGSGKTHFVVSRLHGTSDKTSWFGATLHLPLDAAMVATDSLERGILDTASAAAGIKWHSLAEMDACLRALDDGAGRTTRVTVQIDDLHVAARADLEFVGRLTRFIDEHSSLHSLHYLLTIQDAHYDRVAGSAEFWLRQTSIEPFPDRARHSNMFEEPAHVGGWIVLDDLNVRERAGLTILRTALAGNGENPLPFERLPDSERITSRIAHPLTAVILAESGEAISADTASLNSLELVDYFWRRRKPGFDSRPLSSGELEDGIALLAGVIPEAGDDAITMRQLNALVPAVSERLFGVQRSGESFRQAVEVIQRANLVRSELARSDDAASRRLRLQFEAFWSHRIAAQLAGDLDAVREPTALVEAVERWFAAHKVPLLAESIFEFLILILAREDGIEPRIDRALLVAAGAIGEESIPDAAPWLAGARLDPSRQRKLLETSGGAVRGAARSIFAFLYFLRRVDLPPVELLRAARPLYQGISEHGLSSYFVYLFESLLKRVGTPRELAGCLLAMTGSEAMGVTQRLGSLAAERYLELAGEDHGAAIDTLMRDYCRPLSTGTSRDPRTHEGPWSERIFFREHVLRELLTRLEGKLGIGLYKILARSGWYRPSRAGITFPLSLEMEREANIAIGSEYRHVAGGARGDRFIETLRKAIDAGDLRDKEVVFHILRHTEPTADREVVRLRPELHPILRELASDRRLMEHLTRFLGVFEQNLGRDVKTTPASGPESDSARRTRL